ncbi:MAG: hypothetical protein M1354_04040 [Candidatus Marsarchaeota archaeon]|nr:hypothetical protein [Candidatus Marsarchaeota archaeon]
MGDEEAYQAAITTISQIGSPATEAVVVVLKSKDILSSSIKRSVYGEDQARAAIDAASAMVPYNPEETNGAGSAAAPPGRITGLERSVIKLEREAMRNRYMATAEKDFKSISSMIAGKVGAGMAVKGGSAAAARPQPSAPAIGPSRPSQTSEPASTQQSGRKLAGIAALAAKELHSIIPKGRSAASAGEEERPYRGGSVLPSLPLAEQVAELERISAGLDSNRFDKEHLEIIRGEIAALMAGTERKGSAQQAQPELLALRNRHLRTIAERLGKVA